MGILVCQCSLYTCICEKKSAKYWNAIYFKKLSRIICIVNGDIIVTGWTSRGSNCGGWRDLPYPSRPVLGLTQHPIKWVPGLFPRSKATGEWR